MVFQSLPLYVDPPNWPQQANQQHTVAGADQNSRLPPQPPPPPGGPASAGSIKPGSMAERARLAKIPQPESALKCPRCDSTNTKFCYFNNYSLSQPRHFCKTCRRYWTRGGALRTVPVGGGCRRNKRSKANHRSKSPVLVKTGSGSNVPSNDLASDSCTTGDVIHLPPSTQLPILPPLHHLGDFNSADIGLNFCGIQPPAAAVCGGGIEYPISSSGGGGFLEQWKLQQFPFISNLDTTTGLYPLEAGGVENSNYIGQLRWLKPGNGEGINQVKMEGNSNTHGLNLSRNLLGSLTGSNEQYWSSNINAWTDLPGFTSSSTGHLM